MRNIVKILQMHPINNSKGDISLPLDFYFLRFFLFLAIVFINPNIYASESLLKNNKLEQEQDNYLKAAQRFEKSANAEKENPEPRLTDLVTKLDQAGYYYYLAGRYNKAFKFYKEALAIHKKLGNENYTAIDLTNIGGVYKALGKYKEAIEYYQKSLEIHRKLGDKNKVSIRLSKIGSAYKALGKYETAVKYYEEAMTIYRKLGNEKNVAVTLSNIGEAYNALGKYEKAIEYYRKSLEIHRKLGDENNVSICLSEIAMAYGSLGRYETAVKYYEEALTIDRKLGNEKNIAVTLSNIGETYNELDKYEKAVGYYNESLMIYRKLGKDSKVSMRLSDIGEAYKVMGKYKAAVEYHEEALAIDRKLGNEKNIAIDLTNIGEVHATLGNYDKAIEHYEEALELEKKSGAYIDVANIEIMISRIHYARGQYDRAINSLKDVLKNSREKGLKDVIVAALPVIGNIYLDWGQKDMALRYYEEALAIAKEFRKEEEISTLRTNIGSIYEAMGQYNTAMKYFKEELEIQKKYNNEAAVAAILGNIGHIFELRRQYEKAVKYYEQSMAISKKLGNVYLTAHALNNIGTLYRAWSRYDNAIENFEKALTIFRQRGETAKVATVYANIGETYYAARNYPKAIKNFIASIELKERLRKTASGDIRRDYLASQLWTYQRLTLAYIRNNDILNSFATIERSRAKVLAERLAGSESDITIPAVKEISEDLKSNAALLVYANTNWENVIQIGITETAINGHKISNRAFIASAMKKYDSAIRDTLKRQRSRRIVKNKREKLIAKGTEKNNYFENIINYYRTLLTNLSHGNERNIEIVTSKYEQSQKLRTEVIGEIGRMLYDLLIKPMSEIIKEKDELIIIPDGVLSFVPFETLIDENGEYLAENYNIKYAQSIGVLELIKDRRYKDDRKPLLAFGGAIYDKTTYEKDMVKSEVSPEYTDMGSWINLPGTLTEVRGIAEVVKGSETITGSKVTEKRIKTMSANGDLAEYKVLHFATHGLVVPDMPELSAVVLSQFNKKQGSDEDGYLRMNEIMKLNIKADFVNLSACMTGLGKIYGGEGVVGLTQSFLIAGANALSVSLWQVSDMSTWQFMTAMYSLAGEEELDYSEAMTEVKRRFINGDFGQKFKDPYFWAPFVYYGK